MGHYPRTSGKSKYGLERVAKVLLDLLVVKFLDAFSHRPMHVFGGCGFFSLFLSFLTFLWMVVLKLFYGVSFITTPLPLVIVMTFMVGMMCILLGLLAEMIMRTFYESEGKTILQRAFGAQYRARDAHRSRDRGAWRGSGVTRRRAGSSACAIKSQIAVSKALGVRGLRFGTG